MENPKTIRCIVAVNNSAGEPDLFFVKVRCSEEEYNNGDHYDAAKNYFDDEGFVPKIVFDENDPGGRAMLSLFAWDTASVIDTDGDHIPSGNLLEEAPVTSEPPPSTSASLKESFGGNWGNHPEYPVADWQAEVADDNTRQGYWEWVEARLEEVEDENED